MSDAKKPGDIPPHPGGKDDDPQLSVEAQYAELIAFLKNNKEMQKTARNAVKQGLWAGGGAMGGGLLCGPLGGLCGGICGACIGFHQADEYQGVIKQIKDMPEGSPEKEQMMEGVRSVLKGAGANPDQFDSKDAFRSALKSLAASPVVRAALWKVIVAAVA